MTDEANKSEISQPSNPKQSLWLICALVLGAVAAVVYFYCYLKYDDATTGTTMYISVLTIPPIITIILASLTCIASIMTKNTRVAFYATRIYVVALLAGVICFIIYNNPIKVKMEPVLIIAAIAVILAAFFCGASYRVKKIGAEKSSFTTDKLVISALLIAIGILIPLIMPKVVIEPMSFTLFSHVAIFVGMFISTDVAIAVVIGTTAGFFVSGFSPVVVLRAFSHIVFATIGSVYLKHNPKTIHSPIRFHVFSFVLALVHASCEVLVVIAYYVSIGGMAGLTDAIGFKVLFLLVGLGSAVHSMVDFEFAGGIVLVLSKQTKLFPNTMLPKTDKQNRLVAE